MPTGRDFTKKQWDEIYAARARLEAYKSKVERYPYYPSDFENLTSHFDTSRLPEKLQPSQEMLATNIKREEYEQLKAQVNYLTSKILEMRAERKKRTGRYSKYE